MSTLKVNNLQVGQDSTATNNLTWFQPGSPDGTIRLGSGNAGSATTKFTFDKDGNLTCVGNITANSIIAPIEGTLDDWIVHAGDTDTKIGFPANDQFSVETGGSARLTVTNSATTIANTATFTGNSVVSGSYFDIQNNKKLRLGTNGDCSFYFNGSATLIETGNKIIHIQTDASIRLQKNSPQAHMLIANAGDSVDLYHNGTLKLATDADGIRIGSGGGDNTIVDLHNASYDNGVIQYYNGSVNIKTGSSNGDRQISLETAGSSRLLIDSNGMSKFTRGSTGTVAHFYANARECNILLQNDAQTWKIVNYDYGNDGTDNLGFHDGTADRLVIKKGGNIGINDTSPTFSLDVNGTGRFTDNLTINTTKKIQTNSSQGQLTIQGGATYPGSAIKFAGGQSGATDRGIMKFYSSDTTSLVEVAEIRPDKKVQGILVGRREYSVSMAAHTTWYYVCTVHSNSLCSQVEFGVNGTRDSTVFNAHFDVLSTHAAPQYQVTSVGCNYTAVYMKMQGNNYGAYNVYIKRSGTTGACTANVRVYPRMNEYIDENEDSGYTSTAFEVTAFSGKRIWSSTANNADLDIHGNLSKGSGSFKIPHPLTSLKDTKNLVHSFIEGPSCDLIYRGTATLSSGSATVNIDTVAGMTAGTFAALNKNVQCFTTNESGWGAVKGSVSGNILTITAQDGSSTDNVSWMIVGQRKDDVIKGSSITDANGDLVLEPSIDVTEASPTDSYPSDPSQYNSP